MKTGLKNTLLIFTIMLAVSALMPTGVGHAQTAKPPAPAVPFDSTPSAAQPRTGVQALGMPSLLTNTFQSGGDRLTTLQNSDGGWGWPLTGASALNTLSPIAMGLGKAYDHTGDADHLAALQKAGALLLTKDGNFSPSDGYLAAELDAKFGVTTYTDYVKAHFYDLLAAGTYQRLGSSCYGCPDSTLYDTARYVDLIRSSRTAQGIGNLGAWDVGMGLVGAEMIGVDSADLNIWIAGTEAALNQVDGTQYYDVIGLSGGLYGLALAGAEFDPTSGQYASAWNLDGLGAILESYQLSTGGFTWNSQYQNEGEGNETNQETAYAVLALNALNRQEFLPSIVWGGDYLDSVQLGTGGWDDFPGDPSGENNELTGEALWALHAAFPVGDVWVCPSGNCGHPDAYYNTIQDGVDNVAIGGTVHVLPGTYVEQVHITRSLNLLAEDSDPANTVIQSPDTLAACWGTKKPIICVENTTASIFGFTVDGAGKGNANNQFVGIGYHNAGGTVEGNHIIHVRNTPLDGMQAGVGLYALNEDAVARSLDVSSNVIEDYQKNAMALNGANLTVNVNDNTTVGAGATAANAQNGIQLWASGGTVSNNKISGNAWTGTYGGTNDPFTDPNADGAAGILLYDTGAAVEVNNNVLSGNQFGIWTVAGPSFNIHDNAITGLAHTGNAFPVGIGIWSGDSSTADAATTATLTNNTIQTHDYGLLILDYHAGGNMPDVTATGNTFTQNHIQVASTDGTIDIPATLSGNTFDLAVTVSGSPYLPMIWSHIQDGVNAASSGDIVHVNPGTYVENVTVPTPLEIQGSGQSSTIVEPAVSNPNCNDLGGGSLCTGASNVFLVQANDVTIDNLKIDGDNPSLTSDYNVGGANLDARNGIITDHNSGTYNGLSVHDVTVQNVYLRGIYDSTGSFNFDGNTVTNVQAEYASIAMFAYYGPGTFQNNTVSWANDAISANWSKGIEFLNNTVTHSGSGVHTDNAGSQAGATADLIQGNHVSDCMTDGYGIFVFVPYLGPTVNDNTITNCKIGLSAWGQAAAVTTTFTDNTVDGMGLTGSIGAHISTDLTSIYTDEALYQNSTVSFTGNQFTGNDVGVLLTTDPLHTNTATFHCNSIAGNSAGVETAGTGTITNDFTHQWWGSASGPTVASNPSGTGDSVVAGINYSPWSADVGCSASIPPYPTTTTITSDTPDPSTITQSVTIDFSVANAITGGPTPPTGTVDVTDGATLICHDVVLDGSGNGTCNYSFVTTGSHTLTATFTPADAGQFAPSDGTAMHTVTLLPTGTSWVGGVSVTSDQDLVAVARPQIGTQVMAYNGFPTGNTTMYVPMLFSGAWGSYDSALYIQNTDPLNTADISIAYRDWAGNLTCTHDDSIPPLSSHGYWIPTECVPSGWVGEAIITANHNIVAVGRPHIGSEITSYNGFASGSPSMYVPMLFNHAWSNYDAALYVQNTDAANSASITVDYYDWGGHLTCSRTDSLAPLAAHGYWMPTECVPTGWVGSAVITANRDIVALARPHIGSQVTAYDGFAGGDPSAYVPMLYKTAGAGGDQDSALYIQNVDPSNTAGVTLDFYDRSGNLTWSTTDSIQPLSAHGYWLPSLSGLPNGWTGGVVISADHNVVALGRPHFGSEVFAYSGPESGTVVESLPMLFANAYGGSYNSGFYLQNIDSSQTANFTIKFFDVNGNLTYVMTDSLGPLAAKDYWVPDVLAP